MEHRCRRNGGSYSSPGWDVKICLMIFIQVLKHDLCLINHRRGFFLWQKKSSHSQPYVFQARCTKKGCNKACTSLARPSCSMVEIGQLVSTPIRATDPCVGPACWGKQPGCLLHMLQLPWLANLWRPEKPLLILSVQRK